ncbi:MAG: hypothetical protein HC877_23770, partial [Thioploca sp.]|nr:hypothetical protein [Thioploca sp.]
YSSTSCFFTQVFDQKIGKIGDGICEIADINIATIWSIGQVLDIKSKLTLDDESEKEKKIDPAKFRAIKEMLLTSKVGILDECHLAACDTVQNISRHVKVEYFYGMSASPWRDDGADLLIEAVLGNKIVDISARWLIENNYLVDPDIRFLSVPKWAGPKRVQYNTVYSKYITENEERNNLVALAAHKLVEQGFPTLILFHSIKHGEILKSLIKVPHALLSGKDNSNTRAKIQEQLENNEIKCIIASKIFDIGVDIPKMAGLVCAGGGKSSVRALQGLVG